MFHGTEKDLAQIAVCAVYTDASDRHVFLVPDFAVRCLYVNNLVADRTVVVVT